MLKNKNQTILKYACFKNYMFFYYYKLNLLKITIGSVNSYIVKISIFKAFLVYRFLTISRYLLFLCLVKFTCEKVFICRYIWQPSLVHAFFMENRECLFWNIPRFNGTRDTIRRYYMIIILKIKFILGQRWIKEAFVYDL